MPPRRSSGGSNYRRSHPLRSPLEIPRFSPAATEAVEVERREGDPWCRRFLPFSERNGVHRSRGIADLLRLAVGRTLSLPPRAGPPAEVPRWRQQHARRNLLEIRPSTFRVSGAVVTRFSLSLFSRSWWRSFRGHVAMLSRKMKWTHSLKILHLLSRSASLLHFFFPVSPLFF